MCALRGRETTLQSKFPIVCPEITILISARWRTRFPKYVFGVYRRIVIFWKKTSFWCRRDDNRFSKCAFGENETPVRRCNLSKRYVLRKRDASYVILFGDELGQDLGFSLPGIVLACGGLLASSRFEIGSEGQSQNTSQNVLKFTSHIGRWCQGHPAISSSGMLFLMIFKFEFGCLGLESQAFRKGSTAKMDLRRNWISCDFRIYFS